MFQSNTEHSLPLTWNQSFLQKAFLFKENDRNQDLNIKTSETIFQVVNPNGRKQRGTKESLDEGEKAGLNSTFNPWVGKIPWRRERLPIFCLAIDCEN